MLLSTQAWTAASSFVAQNCAQARDILHAAVHAGTQTCLVEGLPALLQYLLQYLDACVAQAGDDLTIVEGAMLACEQLRLALGPERTVEVCGAGAGARIPA
jgi:hypothetical protein